MERIKIVMADLDESYLAALEKRFLEGFEGKAQIIIITDKSYLEEFFSEPQSIDILLINESLYQKEMERHSIGRLFLLVEEPPKQEGECRCLYKYTSVAKIYQAAAGASLAGRTTAQEGNRVCKCILVYSPIGGAGKTTVAMGLAAYLASIGRQVLYMGLDGLQGFGWVMKEERYLGKTLEKHVLSGSELNYNLVRPYICREKFDILPPFSGTLLSLNLKACQFADLVEDMQGFGDYDFIFADAPGDFNETVARVMGQCSYCILVALQSRIGVAKLKRFLQKTDCSDRRKFLFLCNQYDGKKDNFLIQPNMPQDIWIQEYIPLIEDRDMADYEVLSELSPIQRMAFLFL